MRTAGYRERRCHCSSGIGQLSDQWSFLWDKRRSLWIAAEDCPDGEQIEEANLDVLLARLPAVAAPRR